GDDGARRDAEPPADFSASDRLAVHQRRDGDGDVHRQHLHAVGDRLGRRAGDDRGDHLVLAQAPREARGAGPGEAAVNHRSLDVSGLPSYKFSHHSLMWWGLMGLIAIEGMAFALAV